MSITRGPGPAALEALAAYLTTAIPSAVVIRGWPETDVGLNLDAGPSIAVVQTGRGEEERVSPSQMDRLPLGGVVRVRTALLTLPFQLDVWARSREALDTACQLVDDALHNDLPYRPFLYLTATDHADRPFCVQRVGDAPEIDGDTAPTGEWRAMYTLSVEIDRVSEAIIPETVSVDTTITL